MSEVKFTPGPWHVHDNTGVSENGNIIGTYDIKNSKDSTGEGVFWIGDTKPYDCSGFTDKATAAANAKLIAAAPDLLDALKELLECDYTSGTHLYSAQAKAKAAIEKATL
jgi:hypothetical protein